MSKIPHYQVQTGTGKFLNQTLLSQAGAKNQGIRLRSTGANLAGKDSKIDTLTRITHRESHGGNFTAPLTEADKRIRYGREGTHGLNTHPGLDN